MRRPVDLPRLREFMKRLGEASTSPGVVYFTGGVTALSLGFREQTVDIDIKLDPEPGEAFKAIALLKQELDINIELAAPDEFLPALSRWKERSAFIATYGNVEFRHYDFLSQALSKLERGLEQDKSDVYKLVECGLVSLQDLRDGVEEMIPGIIRYPGVDVDGLVEKIDAFCALMENECVD